MSKDDTSEKYLAANPPQRIIIIGGQTGNLVDKARDWMTFVGTFIPITFSDTVCRRIAFLKRSNPTSFVHVCGVPLRRILGVDSGIVLNETF